MFVDFADLKPEQRDWVRETYADRGLIHVGFAFWVRPDGSMGKGYIALPRHPAMFKPYKPAPRKPRRRKEAACQ